MRSVGLAASDVDRALDDGAVVVGWLNRGTLHLVATEDYWWLHALTAPPRMAWNARRLSDEGVAPEQAERGVAAVVRAVAGGPATRGELREVVARADVPVDGQALVHVLILATLRGLVLRGPLKGGEQAYVPAEDWVGPRVEPDRERALAELARRYLAGHGPAGARDLAKWAGIGLRDARAALAGVPGLVGLADDLVALREAPHPDAPPPPRLMGPFDPLLLGWSSRADVIGPHTGLVTTNGLFRPFALVEGRAVATWRLAAGRLTIEPLEPVPEPVLTALETDAADVRRFLAE